MNIRSRSTSSISIYCLNVGTAVPLLCLSVNSILLLWLQVKQIGKTAHTVNTGMINIDLDQLIDHLELNLPLSEDQRLFLITVCTVMYREEELDHLSDPATKH